MIQGCWTALITPFKQDGTLDEEGLRQNIRFQVENKIDGITALGTTGESPTLTHHEQERVVSICKEFDIPLMIGTGTNSTATTIEKTRWAKKCGASYALIVSPYYNKPTQEGIYRHYMAVADAVDLPIIVYSNKGRCGVNIEPATLRRMAQHPHIIAVKEASGDIDQITDVVASIPNLKVMSGDDKYTYFLKTLGGAGLISIMANLVPHLMRRIVHGTIEEARETHFELLPLFKASVMETNPIPIKAMMQIAGMSAGECRMPLCEPQPATLEHLKWLTATLTSPL